MNYVKMFLINIILTGSLFAGNEMMPDKIVAIRTEENIKIDGRLNEKIWKENDGITYFKQGTPNEGNNPTQESIVYVAYDSDNLYVAAQLFDTSPDSIMAYLGRRDESVDTDLFGVFIDPYHDKRSGFYFGLSAAGAYYDGILYNDDWDDESWDGVWEGKSAINDKGWSAEIKIPFSQLRFKESDTYIWGINFRRDIKRNQEEDYLVYRPKKESGFVSRFVDLVGLNNISSGTNIELLPYVRGKSEHLHTEKGNPFNDGSRQLFGFGADIKMGLSSNITLDGTINPDFGQVEVDPAVVNLSDFETFFSEKRPFFIEGASIMEFGYGGSTSNWGFNWGNPQFFYSRRIGRRPAGPLPDSVHFSDVPEGTSILAAGKITGKIGNNWNIGVLSAVTQREYADIEYDRGKRGEAEVEPLTSFSVVRAQKEFDESRHGIGFISTLTARDFKNNDLRNYMNSEAYAFGLDGWTFLDKEKIWVISGWMGYSSVHGSRQQITSLQESSLHRYHRPDFEFDKLDSSRTSLNGYAGRLAINKQKGNWMFNSALGVIHPGFDVNDLGFMWQTNKINGHFAGGYRWTEPGDLFRKVTVLGSLFGTKDFDGNTTWAGVWYNISMQFLNYYWFEFGGAVNPQTTDINLTRGGPKTLNSPGYELFFWSSSDTRNDVVAELNGFTYLTESGSQEYNLELSLNWKPAHNITLTVSPGLSWNYPDVQWVDAFDDTQAGKTYGRRYVFAEMRQKTFSSSFRINWTFSPEISLQLYTQPLISSADYFNYKFLDRSNSRSFTKFGESNSTISYREKEYTADPDGDGPAEVISWDDPDFTITSLRANAVFRWEYNPGSTLYFVWTQSRFGYEDNGAIRFQKPFPDRFLNQQPDNIFLVKFTYWWALR
ncbi:MAG: carbohydrate binding family 9 domain-containing protein [Calditrichae bacterium]|nr:carbohydrate binding family 9 domain-containing protein [Calditrichia bacterium]